MHGWKGIYYWSLEDWRGDKGSAILVQELMSFFFDISLIVCLNLMLEPPQYLVAVSIQIPP